jgi:hypothetical protein
MKRYIWMQRVMERWMKRGRWMDGESYVERLMERAMNGVSDKERWMERAMEREWMEREM